MPIFRGQIVLGLRKGPDGRFEIDPATAPIVRRIFEEYAAGERAKDIIARLNEEGYRTSYGNLFNKNSITGIIHNEKYIGVYQYKDFRVEDGIPAIVSRELFKKCQRMSERHRRSPAEKWATNFLLTTKLFCGECGQPMTGDGGTSGNGHVHHYYTCNGRRVHKCKKERVKKGQIEEFVLSQLTTLIHSTNLLKKLPTVSWNFKAEKKTIPLSVLWKNV